MFASTPSGNVMLLSLVCLMSLTACGGSIENGTPPPPAVNEESRQTATPPATKTPKADVNTPLSDYAEMQGAHQLASLYYALGELPPDMEALARISSEEYARTSDAFRKQDLMKALEPRLRAEIAQARDGRYFWTDHQGVCLGHYDLGSKSFPLSGGPTADSYLFFDNERAFKLGFVNGDDYRSARVADEQQARNLEARVTQGSACGHLRVYVFAQSVDLRSQTVQSQIVKAQLLDYQRRPITDIETLR